MKSSSVLMAMIITSITACDEKGLVQYNVMNQTDTLDFEVKILFGNSVKLMTVDSKEDYSFGYKSSYASFKDKYTGEVVEITSGTPALITPFNPQKSVKQKH